MKRKLVVIALILSIVALITITLVIYGSCDHLLLCESADNNVLEDEYDQLIVVDFVPAKINGLNREYPIEPYAFTDEDSKHVPKMQKLMELAIDSADRFIDTGNRPPVNFIFDDHLGIYHITKPGPFTIRIESYMNAKEFDVYQLWANTNLTGIYLDYYDEVDYHIQYNDEIFYVGYYKQDLDLIRNKESGKNIWIHHQGVDNCYPQNPDSPSRLDLKYSNGTHSFDGRSCEWLEHKFDISK